MPDLGCSRKPFQKPCPTRFEFFIALHEHSQLAFGQNSIVAIASQLSYSLPMTFDADFAIKDPIRSSPDEMSPSCHLHGRKTPTDRSGSPIPSLVISMYPRVDSGQDGKHSFTTRPIV